MINVFASAGHSNVVGQDRGAVGHGYIEGDLTVELRDLITDNLRCYPDKFYVVEDLNEMTTGASTRAFYKQITKTKDKDVILDIHFNAEVPSANGTETVVRKNPTKQELKLAAMLSESISKAIGTKNRGVKTESQSARKELYIFGKVESKDAIVIVLEICFISNPEIIEKYIPNTAAVAKATSDTLIDFANSLK